MEMRARKEGQRNVNTNRKNCFATGLHALQDITTQEKTLLDFISQKLRQPTHQQYSNQVAKSQNPPNNINNRVNGYLQSPSERMNELIQAKQQMAQY